MRTDWATQIRKLADVMSDHGKKPITTQKLCAALNATDIETKARVRRSMTHMVGRGELTRISDGKFNYHPEKAAGISAYGDGYQRMWRIIRSEKPGWTMADIAATTRMHITTVRAYCVWLNAEGYIAQCGRRGNTRLYRATPRAQATPETPYPPAAPKDTYAKERTAACRVICAFTRADPAKSRDQIVADCRAILARFETPEKDIETC